MKSDVPGIEVIFLSSADAKPTWRADRAPGLEGSGTPPIDCGEDVSWRRGSSSRFPSSSLSLCSVAVCEDSKSTWALMGFSLGTG